MSLRALWLGTILLFFWNGTTFNAATLNADKYNHTYRLPKTFRPIVYDVRLTFSDKEEFTRGQVTIEIQCQEASDEIIISVNPMYIQITNSHLEDKLHNRSVSLGKPTLDFDTFTARFALPYTVEKGYVHYLKIWFKGTFSSAEKGLIRRETEERGVWFYTLFEPSNARRMFPCFDEPGFKAFFMLQLWLTDGLAQQKFVQSLYVGSFCFCDYRYVALSNTNGHRFEWNDKLTIWTFEKTLPISPYLFTIVIGQFSANCATSEITLDDICIWRFSDNLSWNDTAQKIIGHMSRFQTEMTDYLLIEPGTRLHILILPLRLNGMENSGLLYISERVCLLLFFLLERHITALANQRRAITSEIWEHAVSRDDTPVEWWDDIWLSESLTSYLSDLHPIQYKIVNDITEDPLVSPKWSAGIPRMVYTKGSAVMKMLEDVVGPHRMRTLLRNYVRIHQYGTANTSTFFSLLDNVTQDLPFNGSDFLEPWLFKGSHPLIFVDYDRETNQLCFTQTPKVGDPSTRWDIPLWVEALDDESGAERLYWIPNTGQLLISIHEVWLPSIAPSDFV
uniref:Peptidase_M1 domain-containing protein n=1 Tax=Steinernema glaseri TaxID=37863 RepID=A0A1I7YE96_9BILA